MQQVEDGAPRSFSERAAATRGWSSGVGTIAWIAAWVLPVGCGAAAVSAGSNTDPQAVAQANLPVSTFSIVARDPDTGDLGIAVQSRFLGVGAVVPWAKAEVGAIATQSFANTSYGPEGLELLELGKNAKEVLQILLDKDPQKDRRQVGIVDAKGEVATFTGEKCMVYAGGQFGEQFCVQGNILVGEAVVEGMAHAYEESDGDFGERLLAALQGGQDQGGDSRGMQSAALLIVRKNGGYAGFNDRYRDIRVDDHPEPIKELLRIYKLHQQVFGKSSRGRSR